MVDCIMFDVGGDGLHTIHFLKALPVIGDKTNEYILGLYKLIECLLLYVTDILCIYECLYNCRVNPYGKLK